MGGYFAAKRRLFAEGGPDRAVIGVDEKEGRFLAGQMAEAQGDDRLIRVSVERKLKGAGWSVVARKGHLSEWRKGRQAASVDMRDIAGLPGSHNHQNACAAWGALRAIGLAPRQIERGLRSFAGLPHRSQVVAEARGVTFVNDSKATNADSAAKALAAFEHIRWIVGGQMKEGGLEALTPHLDRVRKAYVIGRQAQEVALGLGDLPHEVCETMGRAVTRAVEDAEAGDTVLLAPAGASFDQYDNFERRGEDFVAEVGKALAAG
jgi:UDP-N-acetylmuramoylalanine--D-glutamate ligase